MADWTMIGVPSSAGAHHAGQERAPDALRAAGLLPRLAAAGESVHDAGNLPGAVFAVDHDNPGRRSLPAVVRVADEVANAVADALGGAAVDSAAGAWPPLGVGGDCPRTPGLSPAAGRRAPGRGGGRPPDRARRERRIPAAPSRRRPRLRRR